MFSFVFTYPVLFCLFPFLFFLSIVLLLVWRTVAPRQQVRYLVWRTVALRQQVRYPEQKVSPSIRIVTLLVLILPCLTITGSLVFSTISQNRTCRSDYSSNTDAPLASSVLVASDQYGA